MPVEAASFIDDLNPSNPGASDGLGQGDDHIRLIKSAVKATFTAMDGATDVTPATLNDLEDGIFEFADGTVTAPALRSATTVGLGVYKRDAATLGLSQGKRFVGNGLVPVGSLHHFPKLPTAGTYTSGGTATANPERIEYIENDGSTYNVADFPDLGAYLGSTFGGNGVSTFAVPDEKTTGKFRRSRTASVTVGTAQSSQNKTHTHTGTTASDGAHTHTGTTAATTPSAPSAHIRSRNDTMGAGSTVFLTTAASSLGEDSTWISTNVSHTHTFTTASGGTHTHTFTTDADGGTEARPEAFVCFACIKT